MQPPYALVRASINGGANQTGGLTIAGGSTVQLSADPAGLPGVTQLRWEIFDYPIGFTLPIGWSVDSVGVYFSIAQTPPIFTVAAASLFGIYMLRLTVNSAISDNPEIIPPSQLVDESTCAEVLALSGLHDTGMNEQGQYSAWKSWLLHLKANWRIINTFIETGGSGTGVTVHGALTGLAADDHTQYLLVNGTRAMAAVLDLGTHRISNVVDPAAAQDAATKHYVDSVAIPLTVAGLIHADGSVVFAANQSMGTHRLTDLLPPVISTDAANKAYVDAQIVPSGANAFTGDQSMGGNRLTHLATPLFSTDAANKAYVDAATGLVFSVFDRTGAVVAVAGDYTSTQVTNSSTVTGATVTAALNSLFTLASSPYTAGTAGQALISNGTTYAPGTNFAAQNLSTTGALSLGTTPALTGLLRLPAGASAITSRNFLNTGDLVVYSSTSSVINVQTFGDTANSTTVIASGSSGGAGVNLSPGGTQRFSVSSSLALFDVPIASFAAPGTLNVTVLTSASPQTGGSLTVTGQDVVANSSTGGKLLLNGGNVTGTAGVGGDVVVTPGTGSTSSGKLQLVGSNPADFISLGATPSATGNVRLGNASTVSFRNSTNTGDFAALLTSGQALVINSEGANAGVQLWGAGSLIWSVGNNGGTQLVMTLMSAASATSIMQFQDVAGAGNCTLQIHSSSAATGRALSIVAQDATTTGGAVYLASGNGAVQGRVSLTMGGFVNGIVSGVGYQMIELANLNTAASPAGVLSLCYNSSLTTTQMPTNTGDGVIYLREAGTIPSANPSGGTIFYVDPADHKAKIREQSGLVTVLDTAGSGAVSSVFTRTGAVVAAAGDYTDAQINNTSTVTGTHVNNALTNLNTAIGALVTGVSSVFSRSGAVAATTGDYTSTQVTNSSAVAGTGVTGALNTLNSALGALNTNGVSNVSTVNGILATNALNNLLLEFPNGIPASTASTSITLATSLLGKLTLLTGVGVTITVPTLAASGITVGSKFSFLLYGAGSTITTVTGSGGVTVHVPGALTLTTDRYARYDFECIATDEWRVVITQYFPNSSGVSNASSVPGSAVTDALNTLLADVNASLSGANVSIPMSPSANGPTAAQGFFGGGTDDTKGTGNGGWTSYYLPLYPNVGLSQLTVDIEPVTGHSSFFSIGVLNAPFIQVWGTSASAHASAGLLASQIDTSANLTAYETRHTIVVTFGTPLTTTTAGSAWLRVVDEDGSAALSGMRLKSIKAVYS